MSSSTVKTTSTASTDAAWLPVGAAIADLVHTWSLRSDLVVKVGPSFGVEAPALYNPAMAEVEVNTNAAFGPHITPEQVGDFTVSSTRYDWPKATGAILHEALHARFTRWSLENAAKRLTPSQNEAMHLLEEGRIEAWGVRYLSPRDRDFLRACTLEIVIADADPAALTAMGSVKAAAKLAGLALARVDCGSVEPYDVQELGDVVETILGEELLRKLQSIWIKFQAHQNHHDPEPLYELAIEWDKLVSDRAVEEGQEPTAEQREQLQKMLDALAEAAAMAGISARDSLDDHQRKEEWQQIVSASSSAQSERREHTTQSEKVFDKQEIGPGVTKTTSRLVQRRQPTPDERAAAVRLGSDLERAKYRERGEYELKSIVPPGRLRTRALVQGAALKDKGIRATTEPWRRTVRKHTDDPTLRLGVMVDISGSMGSAMEAMATTAWVLGEAAYRVQAQAAMVYYGSDVFATLKPNQRLPEVNVYSATDGTEKFDRAFKALDGKLDILHGDGAKMLVVASDGQYVGEERSKARQWVKRAADAGVGVLLLNFDSSPGSSYTSDGLEWLAKGSSARVLNVRGVSPSELAEIIGQNAIELMRQIGAQVAA